MSSLRIRCVVPVLGALIACSPPALAEGSKPIGLLSAVPDNVFYCIATRHNPERAFVDEYWGDVFTALKETGVGTDVAGLIQSLLGEEQRAEADRLKELAGKLLKGVDWSALSGGEFVFAERMNPYVRVDGRFEMGPPDMMWLFRGTPESAATNYEGLLAILKTIAKEVNSAVDKEALIVESTQQSGAKIAKVDVLRAVPKAPSVVLALSLHNDVIAVTVGDRMRGDVLALLSHKGKATPITDNPKFQKAVDSLPAAEDSVSYFDMQGILGVYRSLADAALADASRPVDNITNAWLNVKANEIAAKGVKAYRQKDFKKALQFTQEAYELAPNDSRLMYNLACFHNLVGNEYEALAWLEKSVEGGFYAPKLIAEDPDLVSLHGKPVYEAALAKAKKRAAERTGNEAEQGRKIVKRLLDIPGMIDYIAGVEYTDGYTVHADSVTTLTPNAAENRFYRVWSQRPALDEFDRFLPKETSSFSVCSGWDLDELYTYLEDTIRGLGKPGEKILAKWSAVQKELGFNARQDLLSYLRGDSVTVTMTMSRGDAFVLLLGVTDEAVAGEKVADGLTFLSESLQKLARQNPAMAMMALRTSPCTDEALPGFHNVQMGMMPRPAVCGVAEGHLIFASSADAAARCLATAAGKHPSIRENSRAMAEMLIPKGPFQSMSYTDERNFGAQLEQGLSIASMAGGMAAMVIPKPKVQRVFMKVLGIVAKLGPVARKIDFYKSSAKYVTFDGGSWHTRKITNYVSPTERAIRTVEAPSK